MMTSTYFPKEQKIAFQLALSCKVCLITPSLDPPSPWRVCSPEQAVHSLNNHAYGPLGTFQEPRGINKALGPGDVFSASRVFSALRSLLPMHCWHSQSGCPSFVILSCNKLVLRHMPACELNSNEMDALDNLDAKICLYCILMINLIFVSEVHVSQTQSTRLPLTGFDHTPDRWETLYHPNRPRIPRYINRATATTLFQSYRYQRTLAL